MRRSSTAARPAASPMPMACSARMPGKANIDSDPTTHWLRAVFSSQTRKGSIIGRKGAGRRLPLCYRRRECLRLKWPAGRCHTSSRVTARLFALLVLLTLLPAAFVLWFMSAAVSAENESARQRVQEAYRGQLRLVRARLDPLWRAHTARLALSGAPDEQFERLGTTGVAEGGVVLDAAGAVMFP